MTWNVFTFITVFIADQDSRQNDAVLLALPFSIKTFLKQKASIQSGHQKTDKRGENAFAWKLIEFITAKAIYDGMIK